MQSNPIAVNTPTKDPVRYPFQVVCVYFEHDFPIVHEVRAYCMEHSISFAGRPYDVDRYSEDMYIRRLPAFHIYHKSSVLETHYYDTDPIHKIQLVIWDYEDECMARETAQLRRQERWNSFKEFFSLERLKPKPALDLDACLHKNISHQSHTH